jgi:hypothetical protein
MKRIVIGSIVGTIIYFGWQAVMWMSGVHNDFSRYSDKQQAVLQCISENLTEEGAYFMPLPDPSQKMTHEQQEERMKEQIGKPWVMIFYHPSMSGERTSLFFGLFYNLIGCFMVALVIFYGSFPTFGMRFIVSLVFALFALIQGPFQEMNWFSFPGHFQKAAIIDIFFGWLLCSLWLAWYVKRTVTTKT